MMIAETTVVHRGMTQMLLGLKALGMVLDAVCRVSKGSNYWMVQWMGTLPAGPRRGSPELETSTAGFGWAMGEIDFVLSGKTMVVVTKSVDRVEVSE